MRIVSLLPSATEILFAIGAGDEVVGVTHECDYPAEARKLPRLTSASNPNLQTPAEIDRHVRSSVHAGSSLYSLDSELLERLAPDLIVTQELCAVCAVSYDIVSAAAKRLRSDPRIVSLEPRSLTDVFDTMLALGELTAREAQARDVVAMLERRLTRLRAQRRSALPTLVLEWTDPPMSAGHWIPELIEIAGGMAMLADPGADSKRIDWSTIAAANPPAVVVAPCGFDMAGTVRAIAELEALEQWRSLAAHETGRILPMDGNAYLSRPGPRLVDAAEILARWYTTGAEYVG